MRRAALVAGVFAASSSLGVDRATFDRILAVNLTGTFFVAQALARVMVEAGTGAICAVGLIAARMPRMRQAAYVASKAGMRHAATLAMETVPLGVRINFVASGPTDTEMMRELSQDHSGVELAAGSPEALRPPIPSGRVASTQDIAEAVAFLLSDAAAHIALPRPLRRRGRVARPVAGAPGHRSTQLSPVSPTHLDRRTSTMTRSTRRQGRRRASSSPPRRHARVK